MTISWIIEAEDDDDGLVADTDGCPPAVGQSVIVAAGPAAGQYVVVRVDRSIVLGSWVSDLCEVRLRRWNE